MELFFDRGSIIVHCSQGEERLLRDRVPRDLVWDPRASSFRAPAHCYAQTVAALRGSPAAFQLDDRVGATDADWAMHTPIAFERPSLRDYQHTALRSWVRSDRRGVVVLPTGAGKTHVAFGAIALVSRPALVLVPTRVLLHQWVHRLREIWPGEIGVVGDGSRTLSPLTVCTFESAYRHLDEFGDRFGLLVVDEVHHFGSGLRTEALEMATAPCRLGLTATPPRDEDAVARIDARVGPVSFHRTIVQMSGGVLAPFQHTLLPVALSREERAAYDRAYQPFARAYRTWRRTAVSGSWLNFVASVRGDRDGCRALAGLATARRIVSTLDAKLRAVTELARGHRRDRLLIFTGDNDAAYTLSRELLLPAITCDIGRKEREEVLARLRAGTIRGIISSRVLNEGIDLPEARVGIIAGGFHGGREHVQRIGRLLRPAPGKTACVYELVARDTFEVGQSRRRMASLGGAVQQPRQPEQPGRAPASPRERPERLPVLPPAAPPSGPSGPSGLPGLSGPSGPGAGAHVP